ncbi:MAG TPA: WecB/TagA/CpsF family glycosyltransferase [Candidatus Limnocylindria bacterium]|nr:WecB/TagA/CpsF family glycosyltransferase [Candidatus Limnocylindria bacterium]
MSKRPPRVVQIDTLPIDNIAFDEAVALIIEWARAGSGGYINTPNVDHVVRARRHEEFRALALGARLRVPDGMGIIYGSRLAGTPLLGPVTGRLLPEAVARASADDPLPTALLGGRDDAPATAARVLDAAGAQVIASIGPPMGFRIGGPEDAETVEQLRRAEPRILYVGLGSPKQEQWMERHQAELPKTVMVGVGYAIDVLGGLVPAAPAWMTSVGLEWSFRLLKDPRRIGRRVFVDDPPFFWWMVRSRFARRRKPVDARRTDDPPAQRAGR